MAWFFRNQMGERSDSPQTQIKRYFCFAHAYTQLVFERHSAPFFPIVNLTARESTILLTAQSRSENCLISALRLLSLCYLIIYFFSCLWFRNDAYKRPIKDQTRRCTGWKSGNEREYMTETRRWNRKPEGSRRVFIVLNRWSRISTYMYS